jgi:periplasmic divalent cation tolerance protein
MEPQPAICEVIITAPDMNWLTEFSRTLVVDRLCATAHSFAELKTVYWWQGELHDATEAQVTLHTRVDHVNDIVERVKNQHPYVVPSVITRSITGGSDTYLQWIVDETESPKDLRR